MALLLALVLLSLAPAWAGTPLPGDFNQDQQLDQADLKLLRAALGSADSLYDLNANGRVDLDDFFCWADQIQIAPAAVPAPDSASVISPAPSGEGTAVPDTALPLQPVLPADTTALPPALPDSSALLPAVPGSPSAEVLPADTAVVVADSSLTEVVPADTAAVLPALVDSSLTEVVPADSTTLPLPPDSAASPPASLVQLPANMDPRQVSPALPLPVGTDLGPADSSTSSPDPTPSLPPDGGGVTLPDTTRPFQPVSPAYYTVTTTRQTTTVWLTGYTIVLHNTKPFGIASLRLKGQPVDFVHPSLPIGDWEWFRFAEPGQPEGQAKVKLLEETWQTPEVERREGEVVLHFRRQDVLRSGVEVEVAYHLDARHPEFTVEYTIRNHSGKFLISPYMMVGFPGFANQQWVAEVSTAEKVRRPTRPFVDFLAEAQARNLTDYLLLRQDWDPQTQAPEALRGAVVLRAGDQKYTLATTLAAAAGLKGAYIAHTNKPRYLTSHLYAFLQSLGEGQSRSVAVHYVLSKGSSANRTP